MNAPPDLSEARRLLGAGLKLVELIAYTKQPSGEEWNHHPATRINPAATGYGVLLEQNKLCSIDPDDLAQATVGMRALGFDLEALLEAGVRVRSTRPGSGGRSTFAADGEITWLKFSSPAGTAIEFRADSPNLQDVVPGIVYRDKAGTLCTQQYANHRLLDEAPPLPDALQAWWERCSTDVEFLREQQRMFFAAVGVKPHLAISAGRGTGLAFDAPGIRSAYNRRHNVEALLERHGYRYDRGTQRWAPASATGAPSVRAIPGKDGLWHSDHASDPLHGTFDAWTAFVVLDHAGDCDAAIRAAQAEGLGVDQPPPHDGRFPPIDVILEDAAGKANGVDPEAQRKAREEAPEAPKQDAPAADTEPLFLTAATLRAGHYPMPEAIVEGLLPVGAALLHGPAKKGKSFLLLQLGVAIDEGANFLGFHTSRRDVLYVAAEDNYARLKLRLEGMSAHGTLKFMNRKALERWANLLRKSVGDAPVTTELALGKLWAVAERPTVLFIDTQEIFETLLGITHGKPGDSVTRRDYLATSSYDGFAQKRGLAIVLVGHWGELKSIEKATQNPHECINTTKARLAGVTASLTLGPLPNQEPGLHHRDMQFSIRGRDFPGGDRFLWVQQDANTGTYTNLGTVREVQVTEAQRELFGVLEAVHKAKGEDQWIAAKDIAEELDCSVNNVRIMIMRVRRAAKAKGRKVVFQGFELESKPNKGYRLKRCPAEASK